MSEPPRITLHLRRKRGITAVFRRLHPSRVLQQALADRYYVALEEAGIRREVDVSGRLQTEIETDWHSSGNTDELLAYLKQYRTAPGRCRPDASIREMLRKFLFCNGKLEGAVAELLRPDSEVFITGDDAVSPLLLNIPWELAGVPPPQTDLSLAGTLAALPIARLAPGIASSVRPEQERLRVTYCISEPPGVTPIMAKDFDDGFHMILDGYGLLDYTAVIGNGFSPRLEQVKAEIARQQPHIFVMVSHGQTSKGTPQLRLEDWFPVREIAEALGAYRKTFLVLLIACDQTFLEDGPAAHSGALRFLQAGIPAVVAMQGKVRARLAASFLRTTLDHLLGGPALAVAVAQGRKSMTPPAAETTVDWSFPALFLSEDGPERTRDLNDYFQFRPALEALLRSIPKSVPHFPRPAVQALFAAFLDPKCAGLRAVVGPMGVGKTHAIREASRAAIRAAIHAGDTAIRPILYVDFSRYQGPIDSPAGLMATLAGRAEEVKPALSGPALIELKLPRARGADGAGRAADPLRQLVELIDQAKLVLILDNIIDPTLPVWNEFLSSCTSLEHSAVIVAVESRLSRPVLAPDSVVDVLPLTPGETMEFVRQFRTEEAASADAWFQETGGLPYLLQGFVRRTRPSPDFATMMISRLPESDRTLLFKVAHLPNGVSKALTADLIPGLEDAVPGLVRQGLLLAETRFGLEQDWLRVPGLLGDSLRTSLRESLRTAAEDLTRSFAAKVGEADDPEKLLIEIADQAGGTQFLQDVQQLLLELRTEESLEQAQALSLLLHEHLFRRARWWDAYLLTQRVLTALPKDKTEASDWIRLAKAQHVLGYGASARKSLEQAMAMGPGGLEQVECIDLEIALIKDAGATGRAPEVLQMYERALAILAAAGEDHAAVSAKRATLLYNRGIFLQHWRNDLAGALQDLEAARAEFHKLGNANMEALAETEWVDVQLSAIGHGPDWSALFDRLEHAMRLLESEQAAGDLAFCHYQFARFYRRKPYADAGERRDNLVSARRAYADSARTAHDAGDLRQEAVARGHVVEVSWKDLKDISPAVAIESLSTITATLGTFRGDAWARRVLRDMLALLSEVQLHQENRTEALETIGRAWDAAKQPPLHPDRGADARRSACILAMYLEQAGTLEGGYAADRAAGAAKPLIEAWLGRSIDPTSRSGWLAEVRAFGRGPGEYDG